jgi:hypothetical protein
MALVKPPIRFHDWLPLTLLALSAAMPALGKTAWGDERLQLSLIGDRLQASKDGTDLVELEWLPSADFLTRARADDAENAQLVWIDPERAVIALVDGDHLELRWLTARDGETQQSLPLPRNGHEAAALVWPEACALPILRLDYPGGQSTLISASAENENVLTVLQRFERLEESHDPLAYSNQLVAGAVTVREPEIHTQIWWHSCVASEKTFGIVSLEQPLLHPVVVAGSQTVLAFDQQRWHGHEIQAPLFRINAVSNDLERLTPCPIEAQPSGVVGSPDSQPLRLRCWTGGNSPSAEFEVEH